MARDLNRSPFPGMDPYLEPFWGDVHHALCAYCRDLLRKNLPPGLVARMDEWTVVEAEAEPRRAVVPDVRIADRGDQPGGGVVTAPKISSEPIVMDVDDETVTEGFVQVLDTRNGNRVVTVIEFVSPSNKMARNGRDKYRRKQLELIYGGVSLVEIDLIRTGESNLRAFLPKTDQRRGLYQACVTRAWATSRAEVHPIRLQDSLPAIAVPLRMTDADAVLDLQVLMDQAYENGSYGYDVDYSKPPIPPLPEPDAEWARQWLVDKL